MTNLRFCNELASKGSYIDALNGYHLHAIANPGYRPHIVFNLLYLLDKIFGTMRLKDHKLYRDHYLQASLRVEDRFDVVICVHNALQDVKNCISSVIASSFGNLNIIIVDDGSSSDTSSFLELLSGLNFCKLYRNERAQGYTLAANIGIKMSTRSFVTLLNSDTIVSPLWQSSIFDAFSSDESIGIVGPLSNTASWQSVPCIFNDDGDWAENPLPEDFGVVSFANIMRISSKRLYPKIGFINGFCFSIKREVLNQVGIFDEEHFGKGYGEENDYCIRARSEGWLLAVADDCYVYHSQSKSYSHERRAALSKHAGEQLHNKHGSEPITIGVQSCRHDLQMHYNRILSRDMIKINNAQTTIIKSYASKKVGYLLPAGGVSGGSNIIIGEALALHSLGVNVAIVNLLSNRAAFERFYPRIPFDLIYIDSPREIIDHYYKFDALIATLYRTVYWLDFLPSDHNLRLGYYIQDYEPAFFSERSHEYLIAYNSYEHNQKVKCFAKTSWNAKIVNDCHGTNVAEVGLSYDVNSFYPGSRSTPSSPVHIIAMVRFDTPRRSPYQTIEALRRLYFKYRDNIYITVFGSDPNHKGFDLMGDVDFKNLGAIDSRQASILFRTADIFLDCSEYQAMGLTALECMASGVSVVGTFHGGMSEFIEHEFNGLLVDTFSLDEVVEGVSRLVEDCELRWRFQERSLEVAKYSPVFVISRMLQVLFQ